MLENLQSHSALGQVQLKKACQKGYLELPARLNSRSYYRPVMSEALFRVCIQTSNTKGGADNHLDKLDQFLYCLISWITNQKLPECQNFTMSKIEYFR